MKQNLERSIQARQSAATISREEARQCARELESTLDEVFPWLAGSGRCGRIFALLALIEQHLAEELATTKRWDLSGGANAPTVRPLTIRPIRVAQR
jgi:hypothetical protein